MSHGGTHFRLSPHAAFAEMEDGGVILHMGTKRYFSLNETGVSAWRMIESGSAKHVIVASFVERFDVAAVDAASALDSLLAEMLAEELLEGVEAP